MSRIVFLLRKILFLDEILNIVYAGLAIFGVVAIVSLIESTPVIVVLLVLYIPVVAITGVFLSKKLSQYFDRKEEQ